jgi:NADP-dependent 3-hydroxy acid dehydrogenase YdfG
MNNNIQGKVVVITGASSGLGEVTAQLMIDEDSKIAAEFEGTFVALKNERRHAAAE